MYIVLHINYPLSLSGFIKTSSFSVDLRETLIKFHGNPSSVSRVVPCGRVTDRCTDMMKLMVAFRNLANAPIHCTG